MGFGDRGGPRAKPLSGFSRFVAAAGLKMLWLSIARQRYGGTLRFSRSHRENIFGTPVLGKKPLNKKTLNKRAARKPRADALRNRERVLEAARAVFSSGGQDASLEAVAKEAGVGIGTLYRHFPTREALFEAVYRHEVEQLGDLAERLQNEKQPVEALRLWLRSIVKFVATKRGMSAALALAIAKDSELVSYSSDRLTRAIDMLLQPAIAAEEIRGDITADDLLRTIVGMCYTHDQPNWQKNVLRLVEIFIDGLCNRPTSRPFKEV
jgi:AcrR family transcriptional regulator